MNLIVVGIVAASAQTGASGKGYPVIPRPLPDSEEIRLARSAAPAEISGAASVYTIRDGKQHLLVQGTNGCACMVSRDLHAGSLYPICFDVEATKSVLPRELMEVGLRSVGRSEEEVIRAVDSAYQRGALRPPGSLAVAYMMSSRQVLFSSPLAEGERVGPWHPHLMFYVPDATPEQLGLRPDSRVSAISVGAPRTNRAEIIVQVPGWADTADEAAIRRTIEDHYFKAHATGSGESLRGVFVDEGRMFWSAEGQLRSRSSTEYITGFPGKPAADEAQRQRRILMVDVSGDVAVAKAELDYPDVRLIDYFALVRAGGEWKIVSKVFQRYPKR